MSEKKSYSLSQMVTEQANPNSMNLDLMSVSEILHTINDEDKNCALAVEKVLPLIEEIVYHGAVSEKKRGPQFPGNGGLRSCVSSDIYR